MSDETNEASVPKARASKKSEVAAKPWAYDQATSFLRFAKLFVKAQRHMDLEEMRKVRDRLEEDMNLAMGRRP